LIPAFQKFTAREVATKCASSGIVSYSSDQHESCGVRRSLLIQGLAERGLFLARSVCVGMQVTGKPG
jgi:hypothetical protein